MTEEYTDPSGNTGQFRAFANRPDEPAPARRASTGVIIGIAAVVVVVVVLAYLLAT
jgi:hypothetical protein